MAARVVGIYEHFNFRASPSQEEEKLHSKSTPKKLIKKQL